MVNERTTVQSIFTHIAIDAASIPWRHVQLDNDGRYLEDRNSGLNYCLTDEANLDQAARAFRQDSVLTLCEEGVIAVVATDTDLDPESTGSWDVKKMRIGTVVEWRPQHVKVNLWDEKSGLRRDVWLQKKVVGIVQNPLYPVMNEPNSTLKRLSRKLALLDISDDITASGKIDLIIQLPYTIKSDAKREAANQRTKDIEFQLKNSKYGIAYADAAEKITQLNRPAENNLLTQIEMLTEKLYGELGITKEIMNGTAEEAAMINYYNRTIEPIIGAIVEEMKRKFLTKTARTQGQSIEYFRDAFKLMPISDIAETADKLTRNEIVTSNEVRQALGMKPSKDPKADQLTNSNMPTSDTGLAPAGEEDLSNPIAVAERMNQDAEAELNSIGQDDMVTEFILSHVYDAAKAHAYYERTKKLKGRKKDGQSEAPKKDPKAGTGEGVTNKHRATAIADQAAQDVGPQRAAAIQKLADKAKKEIGMITEDFRDWVNKHPRATTMEKERQRRDALNKKNQVIRKLKEDVAKITSAASSDSTPTAATEGRQH
jgi:hypothetical protein